MSQSPVWAWILNQLKVYLVSVGKPWLLRISFQYVDIASMYSNTISVHWLPSPLSTSWDPSFFKARCAKIVFTFGNPPNLALIQVIILPSAQVKHCVHANRRFLSEQPSQAYFVSWIYHKRPTWRRAVLEEFECSQSKMFQFVKSEGGTNTHWLWTPQATLVLQWARYSIPEHLQEPLKNSRKIFTAGKSI